MEYAEKYKNAGLPSSANRSEALKEIRQFCRSNRIDVKPSKEDIAKVDAVIDELYVNVVINSEQMPTELKEKVQKILGGE